MCCYGFQRGGSGRSQRRGYRPRGLPVGGVQGSSRVAAAFAFLSRPSRSAHRENGFDFREASPLDVPAGAGLGSELGRRRGREDVVSSAPRRVRRPGRGSVPGGRSLAAELRGCRPVAARGAGSALGLSCTAFLYGLQLEGSAGELACSAF